MHGNQWARAILRSAVLVLAATALLGVLYPLAICGVAAAAFPAQAAGSLIQVDGGIGVETAPLVAAAGADVLVCGNAVFAAEDPGAALRAVAEAADAARRDALAAAGE